MDHQKESPVRKDVFMAFNQEDLENAYRRGLSEVYLVSGTFTIPPEREGVSHLPLDHPTIIYSGRPVPQEAAPPSVAPACPAGTDVPVGFALPPLRFAGRFLLSCGSGSSSGSYFTSYFGSGSGSAVVLCGLCGYGLDLI